MAVNSLNITELACEMQSDTIELGRLVNQFTFRPEYFNIGEIKAAHFNWKLRLTSALEGIRQLKADEVPDHHQCEFGQWMDKAEDHLKKNPVFSELANNHKAVHAILHEIIELFEKNETEKIQAKVEECETARKKMFRNLDQLYLV